MREKRRTLCIDRETVRKNLANEQPPEYKRQGGKRF